MNNLELKGINYDVGVGLKSAINTVTGRTKEKMIEEIDVIKNELHCNVIRIYGEQIVSLVECSKIALKAGLNVWFSPRFIDASLEDTLDYISKCAAAAEELRKEWGQIVFVLGNELSLDSKGFIEGETVYKRISNMFKPVSIIKNSLGFGIQKDLNIFLKKAVLKSREYFKGEITYASGHWEKVDWKIFDIIGVNLYRNKFNSWYYTNSIRKLARNKKKVAITEFGCCCYKGAEQKGAWGYSVVDWSGAEPKLNNLYERDENVQSEYITDLLKIYTENNIYGAFVFTFVAPRSKYNRDPLYDLDMANFGIIKVLPNEDSTDKNIPYLWERKKAFYGLADFYSRH